MRRERSLTTYLLREDQNLPRIKGLVKILPTLTLSQGVLTQSQRITWAVFRQRRGNRSSWIPLSSPGLNRSSRPRGCAKSHLSPTSSNTLTDASARCKWDSRTSCLKRQEFAQRSKCGKWETKRWKQGFSDPIKNFGPWNRFVLSNRSSWKDKPLKNKLKTPSSEHIEP